MPLPDSDSADAEFQEFCRIYESEPEILSERLDGLEEKIQSLKQEALSASILVGVNSGETTSGSDLNQFVQALDGMDKITGLKGNDVFLQRQSRRDFHLW